MASCPNGLRDPFSVAVENASNALLWLENPSRVLENHLRWFGTDAQKERPPKAVARRKVIHPETL